MTPSRFHRPVLVAALTLLPALAFAQSPPIKPGLWEMQSTREVDGKAAADPAAQMKNLPPEVRAKVEAMMKQKGIAVGAGGGARICMTKQTIDAGRWQNSASCKTTYGTQSASKWTWRSTCTQPPSEMEGVAHFASPERYTVDTRTTMNVPKEGTKTMHMVIQAKWLGADCGGLAPLDPKR